MGGLFALRRLPARSHRVRQRARLAAEFHAGLELVHRHDADQHDDDCADDGEKRAVAHAYRSTSARMRFTRRAGERARGHIPMGATGR